ncbi:MAG: chromate efflux transporter [Candidatus Sulfotelmatobacter sp.]
MTQENLPASGTTKEVARATRLRELATLYLKLGTISFGGPAAAIALMEDEVVAKRQWITRQQFLDMLGVTNLIPGPNSTEMAIIVGLARAGWAGLCLAGACFILPAALITAAIAWAYVRFGALPQAQSLLAGIKPAVIAVIAIAVWRLGRIAVRNVWLSVLGGAVLGAFLLGANPVAILFGGGLAGMLVERARAQRREARAGAKLSAGWTLLKKSFLFPPFAAAAVAPAAKRVPLAQIALFFLKVGAVLYGGGYVLFAFVEHGLVHDHPWLTHHQVLDAIAVGQFTPGPVLSTATFIGYLLGGGWGAAVATLAIFLPSFLYVAALGPWLPRLRRSPWMAAFLNSVNVCAVALMAAVTVRLAIDALRGWPAWVITLAALAALWKWKVNPAWIVLGGSLAGMAFSAIR